MREKHGNALLNILVTIGQTALFTLAFYLMFAVLSVRASSIRGDFFIYTMSGVFLFMAHIETVKAISASEKSTSAMMQHAPMNTAIAISAAAISVLYTQIMAGLVLLFGYYVVLSPFEIKDPVSCLGMVILAWMSGIAVGSVFMAAKPWAPGPIGLMSMVYQRANMVASGKMFVANSLPHSCSRCLIGICCFSSLTNAGLRICQLHPAQFKFFPPNLHDVDVFVDRIDD